MYFNVDTLFYSDVWKEISRLAIKQIIFMNLNLKRTQHFHALFFVNDSFSVADFLLCRFFWFVKEIKEEK